MKTALSNCRNVLRYLRHEMASSSWLPRGGESFVCHTTQISACARAQTDETKRKTKKMPTELSTAVAQCLDLAYNRKFVMFKADGATVARCANSGPRAHDSRRAHAPYKETLSHHDRLARLPPPFYPLIGRRCRHSQAAPTTFDSKKLNSRAEAIYTPPATIRVDWTPTPLFCLFVVSRAYRQRKRAQTHAGGHISILANLAYALDRPHTRLALAKYAPTQSVAHCKWPPRLQSERSPKFRHCCAKLLP